MISSLPAWIALAMFTIGPPAAEGRVLTVALCGGGTVEIPIDGEEPSDGPPSPGSACHAACTTRSRGVR